MDIAGVQKEQHTFQVSMVFYFLSNANEPQKILCTKTRTRGFTGRVCGIVLAKNTIRKNIF
jgi:hypothetical protein